MSEPGTATTPSTQDTPSTITPPPAGSQEANASAQPGSDQTTDEQNKLTEEQEAVNTASGQNAAAEFSGTQAEPEPEPKPLTVEDELKQQGDDGHFVLATAILCHEANKSYCTLNGDHSQVPWDEAPEWQKQSSVNGVKKLIESPDMTPRLLHENWMKEKLDAGWKFHSTKDVEAKLHPCIRPYADLPAEQQVKDHIFRAVVLGMVELRKRNDD